jgi:hypothetical protein
MKTLRDTRERAAEKLGRMKKKLNDRFGLHAPRSSSVSRESLTEGRIHSESPSSYPRTSIDDAAIRREVINRDTTSPFNTAHQPTSHPLVGRVELDTEIPNAQSPSNATKCE